MPCLAAAVLLGRALAGIRARQLGLDHVQAGTLSLVLVLGAAYCAHWLSPGADEKLFDRGLFRLLLPYAELGEWRLGGGRWRHHRHRYFHQPRYDHDARRQSAQVSRGPIRCGHWATCLVARFDNRAHSAIGAFVNAASYTLSAAPGMSAVIAGSNIGPEKCVASTLGETRVLVNNRPSSRQASWLG